MSHAHPFKGPRVASGAPKVPDFLEFLAIRRPRPWYHEGMRWGALAEAVRELEPPTDRDDLAAVLRVRDQFEAKLALGIAAFDRDALWELDNQTSAVAWLRNHGVAPGDALGLVKAGRRAADVPAVAEAWLSGRLSGGQIKAIVANVSDKAAELFSEHAPDLIPVLEPMGIQETARAMQLWRERADALLDKGEPKEPERSLHASETFQGRTELKGSFVAATGDVIRTALRTAETADDEATGTRTPAERRADALTDLCRFFLDHRDTVVNQRRRRPHLNVLITSTTCSATPAAATRSMAATSTPTPSAPCAATANSTASSSTANPGSSTTAAPNAPHHPTCSPPSSSATGTAASSPDATADRCGATPTTSPPGKTAAKQASTTWSSAAPDTTTSSTANTGDNPSPATAPSPSTQTTAAPGPPTPAAPSPSTSPPPADPARLDLPWVAMAWVFAEVGLRGRRPPPARRRHPSGRSRRRHRFDPLRHRRRPPDHRRLHVVL